MKTQTLFHGHTTIVAVATLSLMMLAGSHAYAQSGQVTTLPPDRMSSQLETLHDAIVEATEELKNENVRTYVESYQVMVQQYGVVADLVGDAAEASGEMAVRLDALKADLQQLDTAAPADADQRAALLNDIAAIRGDLTGRLSALDSQYKEAGDEFRENMKGKLAGIVIRIEQMQALEKSLSEGTGPVVPGYAMSQYSRQLNDMQQVLHEEQESLNVVSRSVRLLVESNVAQMRRSLRMLQLQNKLPLDQFRRLQQSQQEVQQVMTQLDSAHRRMSAAVVDILAGQVDVPAMNDAELESRINKALGRKTVPKPQEPSGNQSP